ncbi:MAG: DMT family transporter [Clostridia bacterium]|nr:DMT family transporter [Clostridia bacterium]
MGPVSLATRLAEAVLFALTIAWGTTFVLVKDTLASLSPWTFLSARFALAAVLLFAIEGVGRALSPDRSGGAEGRRTLGAGVAIGALLFAGYALQTWGLTTTTPARSGFLTGLSVVLVPCFEALLGRPPAWRAWLGAFLSALGLLALTRPGAGPFVVGDGLTLLCALAFALQTIAVDRFARLHPALRLSAIESLTAALLSALAGVAQAGAPERIVALGARGWTGEALVALAVCGVVVTAVGTVAQNWAQRFTSATRAAVIFTFEPVFALATAWVFWGERWPPLALVGGALVLLGMIASASRSAERRDAAA